MTQRPFAISETGQARPGEPTGVVDLRRLDLVPGGAVRVDLLVPVDAVVLAGQVYEPRPPSAEATLDVTASGSGTGLRLRLSTSFSGPCQRCLGDSTLDFAVDVREFQGSGREGARDRDDDLDCEYLSGPRRSELDLAAWARDAVAEVLPMSILCRPDCRGLCVHCGTDLNAGDCDCVQESGDPRWAALGDLAERLRDEPEDA